jgi:hypothetical protein
VEVVDILRDDQQVAAPFGIEQGEGVVGGVRLDFGEAGAAGVVEALDQCGVPPERLGRRDILDAVALPQAVRAAEGGEAALRRDAGAGEMTMLRVRA